MPMVEGYVHSIQNIDQKSWRAKFNNLNESGRITRTLKNAVNFVIKTPKNLFQKHITAGKRQ